MEQFVQGEQEWVNDIEWKAPLMEGSSTEILKGLSVDVLKETCEIGESFLT